MRRAVLSPNPVTGSQHAFSGGGEIHDDRGLAPALAVGTAITSLLAAIAGLHHQRIFRPHHIFSRHSPVISQFMCERYVLPDQVTAEREFLPARSWWSFGAKFNVAAQHYVPVMRWHDGTSEAVMMRWGLVPAWAEGKWIDVPPACAEIEEFLDSPTFRVPWLNSQRCILPIAGFYAWELTNAKYRQPYFVRLLDRSVFGLAGIWDRSVGADDDVIESCAIVRVPANTLLMEIGNARMPAILKRRDYQTWLRGTPVEAKATLHPYNPKSMHAYTVSPRINSVTPDDPALIRPIELA